MLEEPWFALFFLIIPLFAGAVNKYFLVKGKKKNEYTWLNYGLEGFMFIQVVIYACVGLINYS